MSVAAKKNLLGGWKAVSIIIGTAVGAGIFGLPFAFEKFGVLPSLVYLVVLAGVITLEMLLYLEVVLRTKEQHIITGYAARYLGRWGKVVTTFTTTVGYYGALVAYVIGAGRFLFTLLSPVLGGTEVAYGIIFLLVGSAVILIGLKFLARAELVMSVFLFITIGIVLIKGIPHIAVANLLGFHPENFIYPFGPILFALGAASAIPIIRPLIVGHEKHASRYVITGLLIPTALYAIFATVVAGVTGKFTSEESILGLVQVLGDGITVIAALFGVCTMFTSFLNLSYALRNMYIFDYKWHRASAIVAVFAVPLILYVFGLHSFILVLSIVGGIMIGLEGVMVILIHQRAKHRGNRTPEFTITLPGWLNVLLASVFVAGMIYEAMFILGTYVH